MGNIFSVQCGDALSGRCWDCISEKSQYISRLEANLIALRDARDRLSEKRNDLRQTVTNQQRPHMEQPDQVRGWLSRADDNVAEATELLTRGAQERQRLCTAGYCSTNCISTYKFGKSVAQSLLRVNALISAVADVKQVVVEAPAKHLESLLQDLADAEADLEARKKDLQQRISSEEGPGKRTLEEVKVWLSKAETLLTEADQLLEYGPLELNKLLGGDYSNSVFVGSVAQHIDNMSLLHSQGDFSQLVVDIPAKKLESNLQELRNAKIDLLARKYDIQQRILSEEGPGMQILEEVKVWLSKAETLLTEADQLLEDGPLELKKLLCRDYSNSVFVGSVAQHIDDIRSHHSKGDFSQLVLNILAEKLESNLQELKDAKIDLLARKYDVQRRISSEEGPGKWILEEVKVWLSKADSLVAKAGQLLEDGPLEVNKLLGGDNSNSVFVGKVAQLIDEICSLHSQGYFSQVTAKAGPQRVVGRNQRPTVGSEEMLEEAWRLLQKDEVGIIGIFGMGGVGKTTLLTHINNKFASISSDFDVVMWVVVSKDLKLENIQTSIWKQVQSLDERWLRKNIQEKAEDIFDVLRGKKFVLLIDDVWQQFDLVEIGVPLPTRRNGCKVVSTTRSFVICKQMEAKETLKVKPLNWKEAWKLFKGKVGQIDADILHVAQKVAEECQGLPIALITIGRSMASKSIVEEWQYALTVLRRSISNLQGWEDELYQGMEVHVFQRLKFSYDSLPNDKLRSCFVYCCLFPEDFKIFKDDLIQYWVAEKFCGRGEGYGIVCTLIHRCLLEEDGDYVKMHDVVRDMAIWLACECEKENYKFFIQAGSHLKKLPEATKWEGAKRVSFMENSLESIEGSPRCCDLVTLFLSHNKELENISQGFFKFETRGLTVLDLSHTKIDELPLEIMKLHSLDYLNLSYTWLMELPAEMAALTRLNYLNIAHNFLLRIIPVNVISELSELRVLNMYRCGSPPFGEEENGVLAGDGDNLMEELICLNDLCELSLTVWSAFSLPGIWSKLQLLHSIRAIYLCHFVNTKSLDISNLAYARQLHRLDICSTDHLEELCIEEMEPQYPGSSPGSNLLNFGGLREVHVEQNKSLRHMTWLSFVPHLTVLRAHTNKNMEEVISAEKLSEHQARGECLSFFEKLRVLDLGKLPKLKAICSVALLFPCLTEINIRSCSALEKLPLNSKSAEGCNLVIKGEESWWNKLTWEDDPTRAAFLPVFRKI